MSTMHKVILAIDTATSRTSVGVYSGGGEIFSGYHAGATAHGQFLPKLVAEALDHCKKKSIEISEVVVGMGPGPFTGLRVGIVFAQTFAAARNITCIGICSLDAIIVSKSDLGMVGNIDSADYIVATDARRNEIYWAQYHGKKRIDGPHVSSAISIKEKIIPQLGFSLSDGEFFPSPVKLAELAGDVTLHVNEPIYLRRPDALPISERK